MLIEQPKITEQFFGGAFLADELFCRLSPKAENSLRAIKHEKRLSAGETIFGRGELPRCVLIAVEGETHVFYNGDAFVHRVKPDEILGLTEAVSNLPYQITVKTLTPCRFEAIGRSDFISFLQDNPDICFRLFEMLGANLQRLYQLFH